jgi:glycosyltransferase involved in cell wall biosynthesis
MKVLLVGRFKSSFTNHLAPFIAEQAEALRAIGIQIEIFKITAYNLQNYRLLLKIINQFQPDLVHAHYGITGLFTNLQRMVPVITTFHGSDINDSSVRLISKSAGKLSAYSIFVSPDLLVKSKCTKNGMVLPCGVDTTTFRPIPKQLARRQLHLPSDKRFVLFSGAFADTVKNPSLAIEVASQLPNLRLIELKDYTRNEVALLLNAVDACLLTSTSEGSPQLIKEALACNCPVVSVDVGDVALRLKGVTGCIVTSYDRNELVKSLEMVVNAQQRTNGRDRIMKDQLDNISIAHQLKSIYLNVLK